MANSNEVTGELRRSAFQSSIAFGTAIVFVVRTRTLGCCPAILHRYSLGTLHFCLGSKLSFRLAGDRCPFCHLAQCWESLEGEQLPWISSSANKGTLRSVSRPPFCSRPLLHPKVSAAPSGS